MSSVYAKIERVKQRCILYLDLFNLYNEMIPRVLSLANNLTDDTVLDSEVKLKEHLDKLLKESKKERQIINYKKKNNVWLSAKKTTGVSYIWRMVKSRRYTNLTQ